VDGLDETEASAEDALRHAMVTKPSSADDLEDDDALLEVEDLAAAEEKATHELQIFERFLLRGQKRLGGDTPFSHPWFVGAINNWWPVLLEPLGTFDPPGAAANGRAGWYDPWSREYRPDLAEAS
jgi:hypothetical protein